MEVNRFTYVKNPQSSDASSSPIEFLNSLVGPTHIHITGKDQTRSRAAVTLLHGNEPSGFFAIYEFIKQQIQPAVDLHFFIASVEAARQKPGFAYRMLPQHKDLNRCFKAPFELDEQDQLASQLLKLLGDIRPECVIDIHNTSGSGPAFGVTTFMDSRHDALVSLFAHRMIVTDLSLGSLMEISETMMPTVTIECGGAQDTQSHLVALDGLKNFALLEDVLNLGHTDMQLEFFHHPIRLELIEGVEIAYGDRSLLYRGLTLLPEIENHNFGNVDQTTRLGFLSGALSQSLTAIDSKGSNKLEEYFELRGNELYPRKQLKLFMVTCNPEIARKDCLFYFVDAK